MAGEDWLGIGITLITMLVAFMVFWRISALEPAEIDKVVAKSKIASTPAVGAFTTQEWEVYGHAERQAWIEETERELNRAEWASLTGKVAMLSPNEARGQADPIPVIFDTKSL